MSTFLTDIIGGVFEGVLSDLGFTVSSTYTSLASVYDPATSQTTETATATATITPVYYSAKDSMERLASLIRQQEDETIEGIAPQLSAVVPFSQLNAANITPKNNDTITRGSTVYTVASIEVDPGQGAYLFGLRE